MKRLMFMVLGMVFVPLAVAFAAQANLPAVNVITDRTQGYLEPVVKLYESKNKVKINVTYVEEGLISRLKAKPDEADVLITNTSENLALARKEGLLSPFKSREIEKNIPALFRDRSGYYTELTYRARAIFYAKERVSPDQLSTYENLADPKWKGKVCVRSGYHQYNLNLFGQMLETMGAERTKQFLVGLKENLARKPTGNDRGQAQAIFQGKCDVALMNSYYMGIMQAQEDQRLWADACGVFFPNQDQGGSYVLTSGAALTTSRANVKEATRFLEFLTSVSAQNHFAEKTHEYPFNKAASMPAVLKALGKGQKQVKDGLYRIKDVPVSKIAENRDAVIKLLDEVKFDN
jgi:iron(III) transport system substrate-binding protein